MLNLLGKLNVISNMKTIFFCFMFLISKNLFATELNKMHTIESWMLLDNEFLIKQEIKHNLYRANLVKDVEKIKISRIKTSDLFSVQHNNKVYLTDKTASYWIPLKDDSILYLSTKKENISQIPVNNDYFSEILNLIQFLNWNKDELVFFKEHNGKPRFYVFIDISCEYCRRLYLKQLEPLIAKGYGLVFVPFLKDVGNKKIKKMTYGIFCNNNMSKRKTLLKDLYVDGFKRFYQKNDKLIIDECENKIKDSLISFLTNVGVKYHLKGSPMIVSSEGDIHYGLSFFNRLLNNLN